VTLSSSSTPVTLPLGSVIGETYEVGARMDIGSMGEIYAARHIQLGKQVAIKVIGRRLWKDDTVLELFTMEARALALIHHPAVVTVEHVGKLADGRAYFVMELLHGETLCDRLARGLPPFAEALHILDQIAWGLAAVHCRGITHRDLKPENVFLVYLPGEFPSAKLIDFGLAQLNDSVSAAANVHLQTRGVTVGTPMYMSPEQLLSPCVDFRADIYALGTLAYEVVLGRPPFPQARTLAECQAVHLSEAPPRPRAIKPIPSQLDHLLFTMLAKDPAHRPTLAQVRAVIAAVSACPRGHTKISARALAAVILAAMLAGMLVRALAVRVLEWIT